MEYENPLLVFPHLWQRSKERREFTIADKIKPDWYINSYRETFEICESVSVKCTEAPGSFGHLGCRGGCVLGVWLSRGSLNDIWQTVFRLIASSINRRRISLKVILISWNLSRHVKHFLHTEQQRHLLSEQFSFRAACRPILFPCTLHCASARQGGRSSTNSPLHSSWWFRS